MVEKILNLIKENGFNLIILKDATESRTCFITSIDLSDKSTSNDVITFMLLNKNNDFLKVYNDEIEDSEFDNDNNLIITIQDDIILY